jgi:hypothetical protein
VSATASQSPTVSPDPQPAAVVDAQPERWVVGEVRFAGRYQLVLDANRSRGFVCEVQAPLFDERTFDAATMERRARLIAAAPTMLETLQAIADESVFNQRRFAEDDDADYFLRCFKAVKERARAAIARATGEAA